MKPANFLAALVLVFAGLRYWEQQKPTPSPGPSQPAVVVPSDIAAIVSPLKGSLADSPAKAKELAALYAQLARVIQRDAGQSLKATGQFQRLHARLLDVAAPPPGSMVGAKIDAAIGQALGIADAGGFKDTAIDAGMRQRLIDTLHGLAQVFGG